MTGPTVWAWRHPRPQGAQGRCIGRTDLPVDARRAKGLARRIQATARRHRLPRVVHTSPSRRCADVGRWLRRWGWQHVIDPLLQELDFGGWEGCRWQDIPKREIDAWCADFANAAPGDGERLVSMLTRAAAWRTSATHASAVIVVAHAGWMLARQWQAMHPGEAPTAQAWPKAPAYETAWAIPVAAARPDRGRT